MASPMHKSLTVFSERDKTTINFVEQLHEDVGLHLHIRNMKY